MTFIFWYGAIADFTSDNLKAISVLKILSLSPWGII